MKMRVLGIWALTACLGMTAGMLCAACQSESSGGAEEPGPYDCDGRQCDRSFYADGAPDDAIFINVCCGNDEGDGSLASPYKTIGKGVAVASEGHVLAVAAGTYEEEVTVDEALSLLGAGRDRCMVSSDGDSPTVSVLAAGPTVIDGFALEGTGGTGLLVSDAGGATIRGLRASGYKDVDGGPVGVGVFVQHSENIQLEDVELLDNDSVGLVFTDSTGGATGVKAGGNGLSGIGAGIVIRGGSDVVLGKEGVEAGDLPAGGCVTSDGLSAGLIVSDSSARVSGLLVEGNAGGGAALLDCPSGGAETFLAGSKVLSNTRFGVALYHCDASVVGNTISGVTGEDPYPGYCLSVVSDDGAKTPVEVRDNTVDNCASSALFAHGGVEATLTGNTVGAAGQGGIWLQSGAKGVEVRDNDIEGASAAGIAVTTEASAAIEDNRVSTTGYGELYDFAHNHTVEMADGIVVASVKGKGAVAIKNNWVELSERIGIVFDNVGKEAVEFGEGNVVAGNAEAGIALQNGSEGMAQDLDLAVACTFEAEGIPPNAGEGDVVTNKEFPIAQSLPAPSSVSVCVPPDCTE